MIQFTGKKFSKRVIQRSRRNLSCLCHSHTRDSAKLVKSQNLLSLGCVSGTNMTLSWITFYRRERRMKKRQSLYFQIQFLVININKYHIFLYDFFFPSFEKYHVFSEKKASWLYFLMTLEPDYLPGVVTKLLSRFSRETRFFIFRYLTECYASTPKPFSKSFKNALLNALVLLRFWISQLWRTVRVENL